MPAVADLSEETQPMWTVAELAEYWRVSQDTILRHIAKGALPGAYKTPSGRIRIPIAAARAYGKPIE